LSPRVIEKDLFSFAAQKHPGTDESSGRKLKRSRGELNRWLTVGAMGFECPGNKDY
jgi:hypothetical protein